MSTQTTRPAPTAPATPSAASTGKATAKPQAPHSASPPRPTDEVLNALLQLIERMTEHVQKAASPNAATEAERFVELARTGEIPSPGSADPGVARSLKFAQMGIAHIEGHDEGPVEKRLTHTLDSVLGGEMLTTPERMPVLIAAAFALLRALMQSKFSEQGANVQMLVVDCTARCLDTAIELMRALPELHRPQEGDKAGLTRAPLALYTLGALGIALRAAGTHKDLAAIPSRVVVAAAHALCQELLFGGIDGAQPGVAITSSDVAMSELRRFFLPRAHGDEGDDISLRLLAGRGVKVPDLAIAALLQTSAELFGDISGARVPAGAADAAALSAAPPKPKPINMAECLGMQKEAAQLSADVRAEKDPAARQKRIRTFWIDALRRTLKRLQDAGKTGPLSEREAFMLQNLGTWFKANDDKLTKNDPKLALPATAQLVYGKDALPLPAGQLSTLEDSLRKGVAEFNKTAKAPLSADAANRLIAQVFRDLFVELLVPSAVTRLQQKLRVSLVASRPAEWPLWMSPSGSEKPKPWDLQAFRNASNALVLQLAAALQASDADRLRFATLVQGIMQGADGIVLYYEAANPPWLHEVNFLVALLLASTHLHFASGVSSVGGRPALAPTTQWLKNANSIAKDVTKEADASGKAIADKEKNLRRLMDGLGPRKRAPTPRA